MRVITLISLLFIAAKGLATSKSGPNDSTFFLNWNIGASGFSNNTSLESAFGIGVSESTLGAGIYLGVGFEYRMKNKLGIHIDAATNFASRSKKKFMPAFESFYSDFDVTYQLNQIRNEPYLTGGLYNNVKLGLSYLFRIKNVGMFPQLLVGWQSSVNHSYRFNLREPGTNYFTNYSVSNDNEWTPYFGAGFTVLFSEYDLAAISGEVGYSEIRNNYNIRQSGFNQPTSYQDISTAHGAIFWKLSLLLRMDFALMR